MNLVSELLDQAVFNYEQFAMDQELRPIQWDRL